MTRFIEVVASVFGIEGKERGEVDEEAALVELEGDGGGGRGGRGWGGLRGELEKLWGKSIDFMCVLAQTDLWNVCTCIHRYTHTSIYTHTYIHTYTHTHTHTHIHTYTHTHIHISTYVNI